MCFNIYCDTPKYPSWVVTVQTKMARGVYRVVKRNF